MKILRTGTILLMTALLFACAQPTVTEDPKTSPGTSTPVEPSVPVEPSPDPYEESPLSTASLAENSVSKTLYGTFAFTDTLGDTGPFLMSTADGKAWAAKRDDISAPYTGYFKYIDSQFLQLFIDGVVDYSHAQYVWDNSRTIRSIDYPGATNLATWIKLSDSTIDLEAYEDSSKLHGLWINGNRSKGYRFLPGGVMWSYSGDSSDHGKWKCPGNNALYMMDSIGFTETQPFALVGTDVLILNGVLYYKAQ